MFDVPSTAPSLPSPQNLEKYFLAFNAVIFLFIQAAALSHSNNKSASTNAVLAVDVFTIFCICQLVATFWAQVTQISVPASKCTCVDDCHFQATAVVILGVTVPVSIASHWLLDRLY
jgi:hypothetical protein